MAEEFLNKLPRVGRGILGKQDQRCNICLEEYGTSASPNGIIERAVRLPCQHVFGSECISQWVSPREKGGAGNNTCPVCRHELFQSERPLPQVPQVEAALAMFILEVIARTDPAAVRAAFESRDAKATTHRSDCGI